MGLDPDDPRPPYQQVANALRAAITARTFKAGDKLPSLNELSERYGVARMTVQQAMRVLRDEGLIVSRQGSGVFVRERTERPVGLRPHIEQAFTQDRVSLDFAGFSGETLQGVVQEPLDKIRAGTLRPMSLRIRILLPDPETPWTLPVRTEDLADDPAFRERHGRIASRHTSAIVDSVAELADLGVAAQRRRHVADRHLVQALAERLSHAGKAHSSVAGARRGTQPNLGCRPRRGRWRHVLVRGVD